MDTTAHPGNGSAKVPAIETLPGCPLSQSHENRIQILEEKLARFENAIFGAAEMILSNPMMSAMLPKDMKKAIAEAAELHAAQTAAKISEGNNGQKA